MGPFLLALPSISTVRPLTKTKGMYSHNRPGQHTDHNHKRPARNQADAEKGISNRLVHAQLRQLPVERIEPAVVQNALLVLLPRVQRDHVPRRRLGHVEVVDVDRAGGRRLVRPRDGAPNVPDRGRLGHPRRAEHALLVAVDVGEGRRRRVRGEHGRRLVPLPLEPVAEAAAGLVAARDEDHPLLRRLRRGRVRGERGFVVGHGQGDDLCGRDLRRRGGDGGLDGGGDGGDGGGDVAAQGVEPVSGLFDERFLDVLGGCEGGQGEGEGVGEMHLCGLSIWGEGKIRVR